jgi:hypothetical protein
MVDVAESQQRFCGTERALYRFGRDEVDLGGCGGIGDAVHIRGRCGAPHAL